MNHAHYDVLVIGAGMSGLAAGIRLAHYGKRVCVVDRHSMPGGLNSFYKLAGYDFDVGLHALTNFAPPPRGEKSWPLNKLLRQLRIRLDEFELSPQRESDVRFPGRRIAFNNNLDDLIASVAQQFPAQADAFKNLIANIPSYEKLGTGALPGSARKFLNQYLSDPVLVDMLLCPVMYYGSATRDDMDFEQFNIMFRSLFFEGFARPRTGVRQIIATLIKKYKTNHGELRMRTGVRSLNVEKEAVTSVTFDDGATVSADVILSSAGLAETLLMCSDQLGEKRAESARLAGEMTFMESIFVLDTPVEKLGHSETITFFNNSDTFTYQPPSELIDPSSGVICCPGNFQYAEPLKDSLVRVTSMANFDRWQALNAEDYRAAKDRCRELAAAEAVKFMPDFRPRTTFIDTFTPMTVRRFTGHINGAVYGAPGKRPDGRTPYKNLFLCGTDQGFLGIVGAMVSGIAMANAHVLAKSPARD